MSLSKEHHRVRVDIRKVLVSAVVAGLLGSAGAAQAKVAADQLNNWDTLMKLYPKRALAAREQGLVGFRITLDHSGHPTAFTVTHTSGHSLLDNETCDVLLNHADLQPPRDAQGN